MIRMLAGAILAAIPCLAPPALAQDYPTRPITMVVPLAPGGVYDTLGRLYAGRLSEILRQQVIVENVPGAAGMLGSARVANAPPDGYQIVFGGISTHAQVQSLSKNPRYNAATDFTPLALVAEQALIMIARKSLPAANLTEFIAHTKANQATMQYGSPGAGSGSHLGCALLNVALGINVTHVPYRGLGLAITDLLGGRIDYVCPTMTTALPQIEGGHVHATAVLTRERAPALPNVASAHEQGVKDFDAYAWSAIFLPKGTPASIVRVLHAATVAAMDTPAVRARVKELGGDHPPAGTPLAGIPPGFCRA